MRMAKIKLTKTATDSAQPQAQAVKLRDTMVPGFLCRISPRETQCVHALVPDERRRAQQARVIAQEWLAEVLQGGDSAASKAEVRKSPYVKKLRAKFMERYSNKRNKPRN